MTDALTDNVLVLVRHGESEWNRLNLFTGWRNPDLTEKGLIEARVAGRAIKYEGIRFDIGFTSGLKRAQRTLDIILGELKQDSLPVTNNRRWDKVGSVWCIVARKDEDFGELKFDERWELHIPRAGDRVWTDDYSNILNTLNW